MPRHIHTNWWVKQAGSQVCFELLVGQARKRRTNAVLISHGSERSWQDCPAVTSYCTATLIAYGSGAGGRSEIPLILLPANDKRARLKMRTANENRPKQLDRSQAEEEKGADTLHQFAVFSRTAAPSSWFCLSYMSLRQCNLSVRKWDCVRHTNGTYVWLDRYRTVL